MCGIFGYVGMAGKASDVVLTGLGRLEYRGYDSVGICLGDVEKNLHCIKTVGRVGNLRRLLKQETFPKAQRAIGHTRWATHGGVSQTNCHPHLSQSGRFAVVHNGIIENYLPLKKELQAQGYTFYSQTDTEVLVQLFESLFSGDYFGTLTQIQQKIRGAYGCIFLDKENPDILFGMKKGSPLVIGQKKAKDAIQEVYISSDYQGLIGLVDEYIILEDGDMFLVDEKEYTIFAGDGSNEREHFLMNETQKAPEKGEFEHFMLKEIFEQPEIIRDNFRGRIDFHTAELHSDTLEQIVKENYKKIIIVASGTSYNAGLLGKYYLEEYALLPTSVVVSAEFKYQKKFIDPETLFLFISQSGETADVLDSLKIIKNQGGNVLSIVNVPGSSIARLSGRGLYIRAGIEIGVASTKAFCAQGVTLLFLALYLGLARGLDYKRYRLLLSALEHLPESILQVLENHQAIQLLAKKYAPYKNFFYLGRLSELAIAMEGSLKLKEISYRHSEAYSSGELKHGALALIDPKFPVIFLNGTQALYEKNISTVQEIRAREGNVLAIITKNDPQKEQYTATISFDSLHDDLHPLLEGVILQLFAYFVAKELGCDIDKPRNLAKSVTVE